ncbi:MAG TPA: hypothetical protein VF028_02365 [Actinomycetota bacterium]|nr:hypothetical protein [Actinomycetota bacterium]
MRSVPSSTEESNHSPRCEFIERLAQQLQDAFRERAEYLRPLAARDERVASNV